MYSHGERGQIEVQYLFRPCLPKPDRGPCNHHPINAVKIQEEKVRQQYRAYHVCQVKGQALRAITPDQ